MLYFKTEAHHWGQTALNTGKYNNFDFEPILFHQTQKIRIKILHQV